MTRGSFSLNFSIISDNHLQWTLVIANKLLVSYFPTQALENKAGMSINFFWNDSTFLTTFIFQNGG